MFLLGFYMYIQPLFPVYGGSLKWGINKTMCFNTKMVYIMTWMIWGTYFLGNLHNSYNFHRFHRYLNAFRHTCFHVSCICFPNQIQRYCLVVSSPPPFFVMVNMVQTCTNHWFPVGFPLNQSRSCSMQ